MHLSFLFIVVLLIFALFPLIGKLKYNICYFFSAIFSFSFVSILYTLILKKSNFFLSFHNLYLKCYKYFSLLKINQDECVHFLQVIFLILLYLTFFYILLIIFRTIFKDTPFKDNQDKDIINFIFTIFFRSMNLIILALLILTICVTLNQFMELENGIMNRIFELILKWVMKI